MTGKYAKTCDILIKVTYLTRTKRILATLNLQGQLPHSKKQKVAHGQNFIACALPVQQNAA